MALLKFCKNLFAATEKSDVQRESVEQNAPTASNTDSINDTSPSGSKPKSMKPKSADKPARKRGATVRSPERSQLKPIVSAMKTRQIRSVVEVGLGDLSRCLYLIPIAKKKLKEEPISFCAIDMFDARSEGSELSVRNVHQELKTVADRVKLVPGDPFSGLARTANDLPNIDLLIVSGEVDQEAMSRAWFYVPRMIHSESLVFVQNSETRLYKEWTESEILAVSRSKRAA